MVNIMTSPGPILLVYEVSMYVNVVIIFSYSSGLEKEGENNISDSAKIRSFCYFIERVRAGLYRLQV